MFKIILAFALSLLPTSLLFIHLNFDIQNEYLIILFVPALIGIFIPILLKKISQLLDRGNLLGIGFLNFVLMFFISLNMTRSDIGLIMLTLLCLLPFLLTYIITVSIITYSPPPEDGEDD
ncbi:hypothetical protein EC844_11647 [Acinetobacter calcoaceticus]|uniref:Uncharacterized protein n=1 Tax=Acinetobacter calcoaceticus TaxID=471 RepID=A0A4R1XM22_ACICA|nr:hypothetical protein EC844_11647 [Acinetobacter calcoaceticus]